MAEPNYTEVTDVDEFTDPIETVTNGQKGNQTRFARAIQGLSNRTRFLMNRMGGLTPVLLPNDDPYEIQAGQLVIASPLDAALEMLAPSLPSDGDAFGILLHFDPTTTRMAKLIPAGGYLLLDPFAEDCDLTGAAGGMNNIIGGEVSAGSNHAWIGITARYTRLVGATWVYDEASTTWRITSVTDTARGRRVKIVADQLTADVDDWDPVAQNSTGEFGPARTADAGVIYVATNGSGDKHITGMNTATLRDYHDGVTIINTSGSDNVILDHEGTSEAENQFHFPGAADVTIGPLGSATLIPNGMTPIENGQPGGWHLIAKT